MKYECGMMNHANDGRATYCAAHRLGFSFAEVMFAVVILGIGFIMVAAVFPVAIKQGQATSEESFAAAVARNGANYLAPLGQRNPRTLDPTGTRAVVPMLFGTDLLIEANNGELPPKASAVTGAPALTVPARGSLTSRGKLVAVGDPRIFDENPYFLRDMQRNDIAGDFIVPTDDRFAWVPLYRRDRTYINPTSGNLPIDDPRITYEDASVAQIVLFGVEVRNRTRFSNSGTFIDTPQFHANNQGKQYNLQPRPVAVRIQPETAYGGFDNSTYVLEVFSVTQLTTGQQRGGYPAGADYTRILNAAPNAMAEGSFVVISDDRIIRAPTASTPNAKVAGSLNGRIFRVGAQRTDLANPSPPTGGSTLWDLYPGYEFKPEAGANGVFNLTADATQFKDDIVAVGVSMTPPPSWYGTGIIGAQQTASAVEVEGTPANQGAVGLIIGRGLTEAYIANSAAGTTPQYEGLPMDVSVYTTVIKVK